MFVRSVLEYQNHSYIYNRNSNNYQDINIYLQYRCSNYFTRISATNIRTLIIR